mmetsp:Transcript_32846/g.49550  ORF Transcript_32846/g.49550 Transcript_32846/m.49550 type:complete len:335 (+) Transcript_32846:514-1518(+)
MICENHHRQCYFRFVLSSPSILIASPYRELDFPFISTDYFVLRFAPNWHIYAHSNAPHRSKSLTSSFLLSSTKRKSYCNNREVRNVSNALRAEFARGDGRVKRKEDDRRKRIQPSETLFVVNFHEQTTKREDLRMLFEPYGELVRIEMKRNYAFVQFRTIDQATRAKEEVNGGKLDQSVLTVEYVAQQRGEGGDRRRGDRGRDRFNDRRRDMGGGRRYDDRRYDDRRRSPPREFYDDRDPYRRRSPPRYRGRSRSRSRSPPRYRSRSPRRDNYDDRFGMGGGAGGGGGGGGPPPPPGGPGGFPGGGMGGNDRGRYDDRDYGRGDRDRGDRGYRP